MHHGLCTYRIKKRVSNSYFNEYFCFCYCLLGVSGTSVFGCLLVYPVAFHCSYLIPGSTRLQRLGANEEEEDVLLRVPAYCEDAQMPAVTCQKTTSKSTARYSITLQLGPLKNRTLTVPQASMESEEGPFL